MLLFEDCRWCGAVLPPGLTAVLHADWHKIHDLHGPTCALLLTAQAQRHTGAYLTPQPCTCGLAEAQAEDANPEPEQVEPAPADSTAFVSVTEAAAILGVSRQAVLDRIRRRTMPANKIGRDYVIDRSELTPRAETPAGE